MVKVEIEMSEDVLERARRRAEAGGETLGEMFARVFDESPSPGARQAETLRRIWQRCDEAGVYSGGPFTRDEANGHE